MTKTILLTGATDGIGFETAKMLAAQGHTLLLHGRNAEKLQKVKAQLAGETTLESYVADLSRLDDVETLAGAITDNHETLDVLINNAGVFKTPNALTDDGFDVRFMVNTIAPYLLTQKLLPLMNPQSRVINLSWSLAQAPKTFTAPMVLPVVKNLAIFSATSRAMFSWASRVEPPMCGVRMTFSIPHNS